DAALLIDSEVGRRDGLEGDVAAGNEGLRRGEPGAKQRTRASEDHLHREAPLNTVTLPQRAPGGKRGTWPVVSWLDCPWLPRSVWARPRLRLSPVAAPRLGGSAVLRRRPLRLGPSPKRREGGKGNLAI